MIYSQKLPVSSITAFRSLLFRPCTMKPLSTTELLSPIQLFFLQELFPCVFVFLLFAFSCKFLCRAIAFYLYILFFSLPARSAPEARRIVGNHGNFNYFVILKYSLSRVSCLTISISFPSGFLLSLLFIVL